MAHLQRLLLRALNYPDIESFERSGGGNGDGDGGDSSTTSSSSSREREARKLVAWLESEKIRHLVDKEGEWEEPQAARAALAAVDAAEWPAAFADYLDGLGCPPAVLSGGGDGDAPAAPALLWLLQRAAFGGQQEGGGRRADGPPSASGRPSAAYPDVASPEAQRSIDELCAALGAPGGSGDADAAVRLAAAADALRESVLPYLEATAAAAAAGSSSGGGGDGEGSGGDVGAELCDFRALPLGFETGDPAVDDAARLLRVLYLRDLQRLQADVTAAVTAAQAR